MNLLLVPRLCLGMHTGRLRLPIMTASLLPPALFLRHNHVHWNTANAPADPHTPASPDCNEYNPWPSTAKAHLQ